MRIVTHYQANDGTLWDVAEQAEKRDALVARIERAKALLTPRPSDVRFENGHGYVQQDPARVRLCKIDLLTIASELSSYDVFRSNPDLVNPRGSIAGRIIDDMDHPVLYNAWYRLMCMDDEYREWGQPYYATHPEQAKSHEVPADDR